MAPGTPELVLRRLVSQLIDGEISGEEFEEKLVNTVASEVDVRWVPAWVEERALHLVVDGVKAVVLALITDTDSDE